MNKYIINLFIFFCLLGIGIYSIGIIKQHKEIKKMQKLTIIILKERDTYQKKNRYYYDICKIVLNETKKAETQYGVKIDPYLILSIIHVESDFRPDLKSWAGAIGLMQILPQKQKMKNLGLIKADLYIPIYNIYAGVQEYAWHLKTKKNPMRALYRYNGAYIRHKKKTTTISKESYYYGIKIFEVYQRYNYLYKSEK